MGLSSTASSDMSAAHFRTHKIFLLSNYFLLGAASSCIFLTLSLRLIPSAIGFLLILLEALTIAGAISGCAAISNKWYGIHMVATVLTAILQGSVAVLVFSRTSEFLLGGLRSYVRVDDGVIILRMVGSLIPSAIGFLLILLQALAIARAFYGCAAANSTSNKWYGTHMVATVLTAILQGSAAVLVFSRTSEFLRGGLRSYVRVDERVIILRMVGSLGVAIFCLEWVVLALAYVLRYYVYVDGDWKKECQSAE